MTYGRVLSVNVAVPERSTAKNVGITGINKRPVGRPVSVRAPGPKRTGLHSGVVGDQIFDVAHHGGDDQAVYAYAREDYDWWQQELGRDLPAGLFGENLTTENIDINGAVIGERWRIGADVVLAPTFGRIPCATFQAKMAEPRWIKRFAEESRPGTYLRVVEPGEIKAGDTIEVAHRPAHGVTIAHAFRAYTTDASLLPDLLAAEELPADIREAVSRRLRR
jgi:MOSC domain-containing protein YiiM